MNGKNEDRSELIPWNRGHRIGYRGLHGPTRMDFGRTGRRRARWTGGVAPRARSPPWRGRPPSDPAAPVEGKGNPPREAARSSSMRGPEWICSCSLRPRRQSPDEEEEKGGNRRPPKTLFTAVWIIHQQT